MFLYRATAVPPKVGERLNIGNMFGSPYERGVIVAIIADEPGGTEIDVVITRYLSADVLDAVA